MKKLYPNFEQDRNGQRNNKMSLKGTLLSKSMKIHQNTSGGWSKFRKSSQALMAWFEKSRLSMARTRPTTGPSVDSFQSLILRKSVVDFLGGEKEPPQMSKIL